MNKRNLKLVIGRSNLVLFVNELIVQWEFYSQMNAKVLHLKKISLDLEISLNLKKQKEIGI